MPGFDNGVVFASNVDFTSNRVSSGDATMLTDGQLLIAHTALNAGGTHINPGVLTSPNGTITVGYSNPNITLDVTSGPDLHAARYIVSAGGSANGANFTTIATAYAAAVSAGAPQTVFIQPGSYTENLTLTPGINISAFLADSDTPNVTIIGTLSFSSAGTVSIGNIRLQTNGATNFLSVTGSAASIVNFNNCYLNCTANTGISFTTANTAALLNFYQCKGNLSTTGITFHTSSSTGTISYVNSVFTNTGGSTTQSTNSAGASSLFNCIFNSPIAVSSTGIFTISNSLINTAGQNVISLTAAGTGTLTNLVNSIINSGTAACLSIGSGTNVTVYNNNFTSTNAAPITGAGVINYSGNTGQVGQAFNINVTTQNGGTMPGGLFQNPSPGFLGEQIRSAVSTAVTSGATTNLTSISLTAGIWDVSDLLYLVSTVAANTIQQGISLNSASLTGTVAGDSQILSQGATSTLWNCIPSFRITVTTTTTVFLVIIPSFAGTATMNGRLSATRVG